MRKVKMVVVALAAVFAVSTTAFAGLPSGGGALGISGGVGIGNIALTGAIPGVPLLLTGGLTLGDALNVGLLVQVPVFDLTFLDVDPFSLAVTVQPGIGGHLGLGNDLALDLYAYIPVGLRFMLIEHLEIFAEVGVQVGLAIMPDVVFPTGDWVAGMGGLRWWF